MDELTQNTILNKNQYRIKEVIGKGGFGITYLAEEIGYYKQSGFGEQYVKSRHPEVVVIKELYYGDYCSRDEETHIISISNRDKRTEFEKLVKNQLDEGRIIRGLNHPNIVHTRDIFEENNTAYMVMDFVNSVDLEEILKNEKRLEKSRAMKYIFEILDAVDYFHNKIEKRILHLDITPSNILISTEDDRAILIDFGAALSYDDGNRLTSNTSQIVTGRKRYYSPNEQEDIDLLKSFDGTFDTYAVGATLYHMLSGELPQPSNFLSSGREKFIPPSQLAKDNGISDYLDEVVKKAMSPSYRERYKNPADFLNDLKKENAYLESIKTMRIEIQNENFEKSEELIKIHKNSFFDTPQFQEIVSEQNQKKLEKQIREREEKSRKRIQVIESEIENLNFELVTKLLEAYKNDYGENDSYRLTLSKSEERKKREQEEKQKESIQNIRLEIENLNFDFAQNLLENHKKEFGSTPTYNLVSKELEDKKKQLIETERATRHSEIETEIQNGNLDKAEELLKNYLQSFGSSASYKLLQKGLEENRKNKSEEKRRKMIQTISNQIEAADFENAQNLLNDFRNEFGEIDSYILLNSRFLEKIKLEESNKKNKELELSRQKEIDDIRSALKFNKLSLAEELLKKFQDKFGNTIGYNLVKKEFEDKKNKEAELRRLEMVRNISETIEVNDFFVARKLLEKLKKEFGEIDSYILLNSRLQENEKNSQTSISDKNIEEQRGKQILKINELIENNNFEVAQNLLNEFKQNYSETDSYFILKARIEKKINKVEKEKIKNELKQISELIKNRAFDEVPKLLENFRKKHGETKLYTKTVQKLDAEKELVKKEEAEKKKLEREEAERKKLEKEKAEKEKLEKEKAEKEREKKPKLPIDEPKKITTESNTESKTQSTSETTIKTGTLSVKSNNKQTDIQSDKKKRVVIIGAISAVVLLGISFWVVHNNNQQKFQENIAKATELYNEGKFIDAKEYYELAQQHGELSDAENKKLEALTYLVPSVQKYNNKDFAGIYQNFVKAGELGAEEAYYYLGELNSNGWDTEKNLKKAAEYFEKSISSKIKIAESADKLGNIYSVGLLEELDYLKAVDYYLLSVNSDKNFTKNYIKIGDLYSNGGHGLTQDENEFVKYYELAAESGHTEVKDELGKAFNSLGSKAYYSGNYTNAKKYFNKALMYGNDQAQDNIDFMERNGL